MKLVEHLNQKSKAVKTAFDEKQVVIVKSGVPENGGGTWLHPKLAIPRRTIDLHCKSKGVTKRYTSTESGK